VPVRRDGQGVWLYPFACPTCAGATHAFAGTLAIDEAPPRGFARELGALGGPVAERGAEAARHVVGTQRAHQFEHGRVGQRRAALAADKDIRVVASVMNMTWHYDRGCEVVEDYRSKGLSLRAHPIQSLRASLAARQYAPCGAHADTPDGRRISVAGLCSSGKCPDRPKVVMGPTCTDSPE